MRSAARDASATWSSLTCAPWTKNTLALDFLILFLMVFHEDPLKVSKVKPAGAAAGSLGMLLAARCQTSTRLDLPQLSVGQFDWHCIPPSPFSRGPLGRKHTSKAAVIESLTAASSTQCLFLLSRRLSVPCSPSAGAFVRAQLAPGGVRVAVLRFIDEVWLTSQFHQEIIKKNDDFTNRDNVR